jgi:hypothetical protein
MRTNNNKIEAVAKTWCKVAYGVGGGQNRLPTQDGQLKASAGKMRD